MKEKTITNQILKYLKSEPECFAFKEHGGIYGVSGIPDIICCYKGKFMAFEVKTEKGKLSKLQEITTKQDREKAFHDILVALKRNSYEYFSSQLGADVNALKKAIEGKKALEELEKTHISLD